MSDHHLTEAIAEEEAPRCDFCRNNEQEYEGDSARICRECLDDLPYGPLYAQTWTKIEDTEVDA